MKTTHTTTVTLGDTDYELEVDVDVAPAERDVGIMSDYVDDWNITSVNGDTSQSSIDAFQLAIEADWGDDWSERFVDRLHDEGAVDVGYDDEYPEYDD